MILIAGLCSLSLCLVHYADARPRPKKKAKVSSALSGLTWGESHHKVINLLKEIIKSSYEKKLSEAGDIIQSDRLRVEMKQKMDQVAEGYVEFNGQRTGYSISFIKDDFAQNNGETLLKYDEGSRTRYFFFRYDQLWKVVVSYPSSDGSGFENLFDQVKKRFGRPVKKDWETPHGGSRHMVRAFWEDDKTRLIVEDMGSFYGCYVMKLISRVKGDEIGRIHESRRETRPAPGTARKIGGGSVDIFGEEEDVSEVVDQITGEKHDVDLERVKMVPAE